MSTRPEKVNSVIQRELAAFILAEGYEGIKGLFTITEVQSTPDLEHAKVFFSVVGQDPADVLGVLKKHIYEIQGMLYRKLKMKKVPRVNFQIDPSGEYADHIGKLLKDIKP